MNAITPFVFEDSLVRTVQRGGLPWFVGKDVCEVLDIGKHHQALDRLDDDERGTYSVGTPGGEQMLIVISEAGVYRLIFTSRKPSAERFKRWLAHEVLPALRRTGQYGTAQERAAPHNPYLVTSEAIPVLQTSLAMVREARHLFGHERARAMWSKLGLPVMPHDPHVGTWAAADLLQIILMGQHEGEPLEHWLKLGLEGDAPATAAAKRGGIWPEPHNDGFVIANRHSVLEHVLEGTDWDNGRWQWVLRRLAGAVPVKPRHFGRSNNSRGIFLPSAVLDFGRYQSEDGLEL